MPGGYLNSNWRVCAAQNKEAKIGPLGDRNKLLRYTQKYWFQFPYPYSPCSLSIFFLFISRPLITHSSSCWQDNWKCLRKEYDQSIQGELNQQQWYYETLPCECIQLGVQQFDRECEGQHHRVSDEWQPEENVCEMVEVHGQVCVQLLEGTTKK